jgi:2-haloacid dehalogenase
MSAPEAVAFDVYGTLVDPIRIWQRLEQYLLDEALRVAEVWRQKQLEYTVCLTAMERYEDFERVTRKAFDYGSPRLGGNYQWARKTPSWPSTTTSNGSPTSSRASRG